MINVQMTTKVNSKQILGGDLKNLLLNFSFNFDTFLKFFRLNEIKIEELGKIEDKIVMKKKILSLIFLLI